MGLSNESLVVENQLARHFKDHHKNELVSKSDSKELYWSEILSDDNSFAESEDDEFAARLCQNEFDRFIASSPWFSNEFDAFYDRMEDEEMNDVRCLLADKIIDEAFLRETIGMDAQN